MSNDFPSGISSARQLAEYMQEQEERQRAEQAEKDRLRRVGEATLELNDKVKCQVRILKDQLAEAQKANELPVKQAADSARGAKRALIVAIISLLVAVLSLMK